MPNIEMTEEQYEEVKLALTLLAGSNRWPHFVGLTRDTEAIDRLIEKGEINEAVDRLRRVSRNSLALNLASVAIQAREEYLISKGASG